jgi:hypothetical protein
MERRPPGAGLSMAAVSHMSLKGRIGLYEGPNPTLLVG